MKRMIGLATFAVMLSACATGPAPAPKYEAATSMNSPGFITAPAEGGRFVVAYTGDKSMTRAQVAEFALLRAAEFTAESGKEWFAVINTKSQNVQLQSQEDLKGRSGGFVGGAGGASTGAGGSGASSAPRGTADASTSGGSSAGGFGGGAPPTQVMDRWTPPTVPQTVIVIQMGSGEQASFAGVDKAPQIYSAKNTAAEIRAKMKP